MNGEVCCILQVCCPAAQQLKALTKWMATAWNIAADTAAGYAKGLLAHVDLGPKAKVPQALLVSAGVIRMWMATSWNIDPITADRYATVLTDHVDLAPKDSITPMLRAAAEMDRHHREH